MQKADANCSHFIGRFKRKCQCIKEEFLPHIKLGSAKFTCPVRAHSALISPIKSPYACALPYPESQVTHTHMSNSCSTIICMLITIPNFIPLVNLKSHQKYPFKLVLSSISLQKQSHYIISKWPQILERDKRIAIYVFPRQKPPYRCNFFSAFTKLV